MVWQVAIPIAIDAVRYCAEVYAVESKNTTAVERERINATIRALEIQRDMESVQAQKDILQTLIQATLHMFDRKMDYFQETFRTFAQQLARQRQALSEEKTRLEAGLFDRTLPKEQRYFLFKRIGDISRELADLNTTLRERSRELDELVFRLSSQLPPQSMLPRKLR